jgi:hypothetical protein
MFLLVITFIGCEVAKQGVVVYCMNDTTSNFHIGTQNGQRIKQGEVSQNPIAFVTSSAFNNIVEKNLCRDYGCFAKVKISYKDDPDSDNDGPYQDTIVVVEEPQTGVLSVYSLLDFVDVSIKKTD